MNILSTHRFTVLFIVVFVITWMPVTEVLPHDVTGPLFDALMYLGLFVGVFAIAGVHRGRALIAASLAALAAVLRAALLATGHEWLAVASNVASALFFAFVAFAVLAMVMQAPRITSDVIFGAIAVYFLVAIAFSLTYFALELSDPGSLLEQGKRLVLYDDDLNAIYAPFVYFSFVTISTLGYGDIVPVSSIMRHLVITEAVMGQLYLAVLVARLVGMKISHDFYQAQQGEKPEA